MVLCISAVSVTISPLSYLISLINELLCSPQRDFPLWNKRQKYLAQVDC